MNSTALSILFFSYVFGFTKNDCLNLRDIDKEGTVCTSFEPVLTAPDNEHLLHLLPESVDWREENAVTPVKNQGSCGSCWTFSSTGAMEGAYALYSGKLESFSEQQLLDCVKKDLGCRGGEMVDAFEYVSQNPVCREQQDPYKARDKYCVTCTSPVEFSGCEIIEQNNQLALKEAVAMYGPVSVGIQADQPIFRNYKGGIIQDESCGTDVDHGVLVVGYGEDNGIKYWLVKNSWGEDWGENGYVRILREDTRNAIGICAIASSASFPYI